MRWPSIDPVDADADLRRWADRFPDAVPIGALVPRREQAVVGVVTGLRLLPGRWLTVVLRDGSGEVEATWTGRSSLPGVDLGGALRCAATVAEEPDGRRVLRSPAWRPVAGPFA